MEITQTMVAQAMTFIKDLRSAPVATNARYDREADLLIITLTNRVVLLVEPQLVTHLAGAEPEMLEKLMLGDAGRSLYWPDLKKDLCVIGLTFGRIAPYDPNPPGLKAVEEILQILSFSGS